jgi:hypothetical protein
MNKELEQVKEQIAALEVQHKELSLKKELDDSETYDLRQIPLKLARLEIRYNSLVQFLANPSAPTQGNLWMERLILPRYGCGYALL